MCTGSPCRVGEICTTKGMTRVEDWLDFDGKRWAEEIECESLEKCIKLVEEKCFVDLL